jgi:hypothetical protein
MLIFAPSKSNVGHEAAAPINMKAAYFMLRANKHSGNRVG